MKIENPNEYKFIRFEKSKSKTKKYDAILINKKTGNMKRVPFGDNRYKHYQDRVLGLYSNLDHLDNKRRQLYRNRHNGEQNNKYSSGYWAWYYLW